MSLVLLLYICSFLVQHVGAQSVPFETSCSQNTELLSENELNSTAAIQIEGSKVVASLDECAQICCENPQCNAVTFLIMELSNDCILFNCQDLAECYGDLIPSSFAVSVIWNTKSQPTNGDVLPTDSIIISTDPVLNMFTDKSVIPEFGDVDAVQVEQSTIEIPSPTPWVQDMTPGIESASEQNNIARSSTTQLLVDQEVISSVQPIDNTPGVTDVQMKNVATDASLVQSTVVEVEPSPTPFETQTQVASVAQSSLLPMSQTSPGAAAEELYETGNHVEERMDKSDRLEIVHLTLTACGLILFGGLLMLLAYNIRTARRYQYRQLE